MPDIRQIPLDAIDARSLTRDRAVLDRDEMAELRASIAANGLRQPIEVYALGTPRPPVVWGLISGLRRLTAYRQQLEATGQDRYRTIPAFVRAPASVPEALAAMVEENEIRAGLSPWERGRIAALAARHEIFPTVEEAVATLYGALDKDKRSRLRGIARVVDELDGWLTAPERLSQRQCLRLAGACRMGFGHVLRTALEEASVEAPEDQWRLIEPILAESEGLPPDAPSAAERPLGPPTRPRRVLRPRRSLTIRREKTRDGWSLHFTGYEATSALLDLVFDDIERKFAPPPD